MKLGSPLQIAGLVLAGVTFATIGIGHVLVRRLHARFSTRPAVPFIVAGLLLLVLSLITNNNLLSGVFGITAITLVWDGIEFHRQEKRVKKDKGLVTSD